MIAAAPADAATVFDDLVTEDNYVCVVIENNTGGQHTQGNTATESALVSVNPVVADTQIMS